MATGGGALKVFCSYRSADLDAVEDFAGRLRASGVEAWLDLWEIAAGDNLVTRMDEGVDGCDAALIFISEAWFDRAWAYDEYTSLVLRKVEDGIRLIPLLLEDDAGGGLSRRLPARLRVLARRSVADFDSVLDALLGVDRRPGVAEALRAPVVAARLRLAEVGATGTGRAVRSTLEVDGQEQASGQAPWPAASLVLDGAASGFLLAGLGRRVGAVLFAGEVGAAVEGLVDGLGAGAVLDLSVHAPERLAALPFEAALLPSGRAPALIPGVRLWRLLGGGANVQATPPAAPGPLKVLVAVGAPDEGQTPNQAVDVEAEMGSILDAVAGAVRDGRAEVRILEVANAETIGAALAEDDYHVLHLFGHGSGDHH